MTRDELVYQVGLKLRGFEECWLLDTNCVNQSSQQYETDKAKVAIDIVLAECEAIARRSERINKEEFLRTACGGETLDACANTAEHIADFIAALS